MQILMKQYGRTILSGCAAVLILGMAAGWMKIVRNQALDEMYENDVAAFGDTDALKAFLSRKNPQIIYTDTRIIPGASVNAETMFLAEDADGNAIGTEIVDIFNCDGKSLLYLSKEDKKQKIAACDPANMVFPAAGVYRFLVRAVDSKKRTAYRQYKIPVCGS